MLNKNLRPLFERRSIRSFKNKKIEDNLIRDILQAAMAAPSAVAKDPWRFIVVDDNKILLEISEKLPKGCMIKDASHGIVVCGDIKIANGNLLSYMIQDCSAAIENALLAVHMLGLGGVWLGVHPREERMKHVVSMFKLPENIIPVSILALGYPSEKKAPRSRYKEENVHYNKW